MAVNPHKKYPINPKHLQTDRKRCIYCPHPGGNLDDGPDNTNKCAICGVGTTDFIFGTLVGLAQKTGLPMAAIERIDHACDNYTLSKVIEDPSGYEKDGYIVSENRVYKIINLASASKLLSLGTCWPYRRANPWLDERCKNHDIAHAIDVFKAVDNDDGSILSPYPSTDEPAFEYYLYRCECSTLYEILIPLYIQPFDDQKSVPRYKMGLMGILIIGQVAIGPNPGGDRTPINLSCSEEQEKVIQRLREEAWHEDENHKDDNTEENAPHRFINIEEVLAKHGDAIISYLQSMRNRVIIRENDFLQLYQSECIRQYLEDKDREDAVAKETYGVNTGSERLQKCVMHMFTKVAKDFDVEHMYVFFPDLDTNHPLIAPIATGVDVVEREDAAEEEWYSISFDLARFPDSQDIKVEIDQLVDSGCLTWQKNFVDILTPEEITRGVYSCYATKRGEEDNATFFGIFFQWRELPPEGPSKKTRRTLFSTLISVCLADIMAYVAAARSDRLRSFADATRHDLAQRLQTLDSLIVNFSQSTRRFETAGLPPTSARTKMFIENCKDFIDDNTAIHDALSFLKDALDNPELQYPYEPEIFNPYTRFFYRLYKVCNAGWYQRNYGHQLTLNAMPSGIENTCADPRMFYRVILNLLDNAFKYSPMGTNIYLQSFVDNDKKQFRFEVINFGHGIDESLKDDIFMTGQRGTRTRKGEGLGLSIAKDFVDLHIGVSGNKSILDITSGLVHKNTIIEERKNDDGWVSDVNIAYYYILQKLSAKNDAPSSVLKLWETSKEEAVRLQSISVDKSELKYGKLLELARRFGKRNIFDLILVDPTTRSWSRGHNIEYTSNRITVGQKKPLYMIRFSLCLPMDIASKEGM